MKTDVSTNAKCGYTFKPLYDYSNYPRLVTQWGEFETYKRTNRIVFPLAFSVTPSITAKCEVNGKHYGVYYFPYPVVTGFKFTILMNIVNVISSFIFRKPITVQWVAIAVEEK